MTPSTQAVACLCHSPAPSTADASYDTHVIAESECSLCGSRAAVMTPAAYIGCFLSDGRGPQGRSVRVWCGSCGLYRYESVGGVHRLGCPALSHSPTAPSSRQPVDASLHHTLRLPPPPDPMHVRHHAVSAQ